MSVGQTHSECSVVLVDWGTTNFRLWGVSPFGKVLSHVETGQGMRTLTGNGFAEVLADQMSSIKIGADTPVIMCGMVGSRQGWTEAPYIQIPCSLDYIVKNSVSPPTHDARNARILPGLAKYDEATPDVMRSEETQLLGLQNLGLLSAEETLVCMPGSHAKWVKLKGRSVENFHTSMTGELISVLSTSSVLKHAFHGTASFPEVSSDDPTFLNAVRYAIEHPSVVLNSVFITRSRGLLNGENAQQSAAWLSGTIIGNDVSAARLRHADTSVVLVGGGKQGPLYERALSMAGLSVTEINGADAVIAGLAAAAKQIWPQAFYSAEKVEGTAG